MGRVRGYRGGFTRISGGRVFLGGPGSLVVGHSLGRVVCCVIWVMLLHGDGLGLMYGMPKGPYIAGSGTLGKILSALRKILSAWGRCLVPQVRFSQPNTCIWYLYEFTYLYKYGFLIHILVRPAWSTQQN